MSQAGFQTLGILAMAVVLLVTNRVRIDIIGALILLALYFTGLVHHSATLFSGVNNEAVIIIAGMMAMGEGLVRTGVTSSMGRYVRKIGGGSETKTALALMVAASISSAFVSDVGITSIFIPAILEMHSKVQNFRPARLLLPLAFAAMLGGLLTLVGSSGNILANTVLMKSGYAGLSLFAITPLGIVLVGVGILYMLLIGRRQIPDGHANDAHKPLQMTKEFLTDIEILDESPLIGKSSDDPTLLGSHNITVLRIARSRATLLRHGSKNIIRKGDVLIIRASINDLALLQNVAGISVRMTAGKKSVDFANGYLTEVLLVNRTTFIGRTIPDLFLQERYGLSVIAVWRQNRDLDHSIHKTRLQAGDILLVQGPSESLNRFALVENVMLLSEVQPHALRKNKSLLAISILLSVLLASALNLISITVAGLLGATLMVLSGVLTMKEAYDAIEWKILALIAGMIPLGEAMTKSGLVALVAHTLAIWFSHSSPYVLLLVFFGIGAIFTQIMSNSATAFLLSPIAIAVAKTLHFSPYPFVLAIVAAVSASPITPISNKVNLIVMGPGGYKYFDYLKIGLPLTVLMAIVSTLFIPLVWPFH